MKNPQTFRALTSYISTGTALLLIAGVFISGIPGSSGKAILQAGAWALFAASSVYLVIFHPKVVMFDEAIVVVNPLHTFTIGWHEVDSIEARYTMSIQTQGRTVYAWAAPAPGRYHARNIHPTEVKGLQVSPGGIMRTGESPRSDSGVAAHLARRRLDQFRSGDQIQVASSTKWNPIGAAVTLGSLALALILHFM